MNGHGEQNNTDELARSRVNRAAGIVDVARELMDEEFQREVWVSCAIPGVVSSYYETTQAVEDFDVNDIAGSPAEYGFNGHQGAMLEQLLRSLRIFQAKCDSTADHVVVNHPDWKSVRIAAAAFVNSLQGTWPGDLGPLSKRGAT